MTLVAGLSIGGLPCFMGDLLVSWRLKAEVELPTGWAAGIFPGLDDDHAAGLAQKLLIIRPYLMIAWAGGQKDATRIARELDAALPATLAELANPTPVFDILETCPDGTAMVALLVWQKAIQPLCLHTRGFEMNGKRIYLLGSGAPDFFQFLEAHPEALPEIDSNDGLIVRATMLRFAARALTLQLVTGEGLSNSWGGGFEVVYPSDHGLAKLDKILVRAWMVDEMGEYWNSGRSFFLRYYGKDLHLCSFNPGERTFVIPSPVGVRAPLPEYERLHPEWTIDVFIIKQSGSFVEFARYHPAERPMADTIEMANGELVGWEMDRNHVEQCVATAIATAPQGAFFDMKMYRPE